MTIQEAIKESSVRPYPKSFKRKDWEISFYCCQCSGECGEIFLVGTTQKMYLRTDDILATDWEVKEF